MPDLPEHIRAIIESALVHNMPVEQATNVIVAAIVDALSEVVDADELSEFQRKLAATLEQGAPPLKGNHWGIAKS